MSSYYIDTIDSIGGSGAVASSQDQANLTGPYFMSEDFIGGNNCAVSFNSSLSGPALVQNLGTMPAGLTSANFEGAIGWWWITCTAANNGGIMNMRPNFLGPNNTFFTVRGPSVALHSFKYIFRTPNVPSVAADRYILHIGPCIVTNGTVNAVTSGWALRYTDTENGGNWTFREVLSQAVTTTTNSVFAFAPGTWHRLEVLATNTSVNVNLTTCGLNDTQTIFSGTSQLLSSSPNIAIVNPVGFAIWRVTSTGIGIASILDYMSLTIGTTGRPF